MIIIKPVCGLCNRLRALFSYYNYSIDTDKKILIIWDILPDCSGLFLDYFQEIENVIFTSTQNYTKEVL